MLIPRFLTEDNPSAGPLCILLIRLTTGAIFLHAGMQKFLFADERGAGRFEEIGIPFPNLMGPFVGFFEMLCGTLLILGLMTRLAAVPPVVIMIVAILTTKVPVFAEEGFWAGTHAARLDWTMLISSIVLILYGGGMLAADRWVHRRGRR